MITGALIGPLRTLAELGIEHRTGYWGAEPRDEAAVRVVRNGDIDRLGAIRDDLPARTLTQLELARARLQEGDVLVTTSGDVGKCALWRASQSEVAASNFVRRFRINDPIGARFLYCYLRAPWVQKAMRGATRGITIPNLPTSFWSALRVPWPEPAVQRRIVDEIDKQLSRLDEAVANVKRVRANLQHFVAATLRAAFAGRLVPHEADLARQQDRAFEPGSELLAKLVSTRDGRKSKAADPSQTSISEHAVEGWAWTTLGECFKVAVGATPSRKEPAYWGGSVSWVSSGEVQFSRISRTNESITQDGLANSSTQINPAGSVLLGMIGQGRTRGQAAILDLPAANNQNCAAIWVSQTPVPPEFVYYWLMSRYEQTRGEGSGNNQQALNKKLVEAIPLPLPPLREQHRIVAEVDRRLSIVREVEAEVDANLKRAEALRSAVLASAFRLQ